jgi:uncharacterized membrane protein
VTDTTLGIVALVVLLAVAAGIVVFSVVFMSAESRHTAEANQQIGQPVSNGYAGVAIVSLIVIFIVTVALGLLPPLLRR